MIAILFSAAALGGVLCAEARGMLPDGRNEVLAIAQVAVNRAKDAGLTVDQELRRPQAWAKPTCPSRESVKFVTLARKFLAGELHSPHWSRHAMAFATKAASKRVSGAWRQRGYVPMSNTETIHVFWRMR